MSSISFDQTEVALDKIRFALKEARSGLEHIFKMTIYLRTMNDYQTMREFFSLTKGREKCRKEQPVG